MEYPCDSQNMGGISMQLHPPADSFPYEYCSSYTMKSEADNDSNLLQNGLNQQNLYTASLYSNIPSYPNECYTQSYTSSTNNTPFAPNNSIPVDLRSSAALPFEYPSAQPGNPSLSEELGLNYLQFPVCGDFSYCQQHVSPPPHDKRPRYSFPQNHKPTSDGNFFYERFLGRLRSKNSSTSSILSPSSSIGGSNTRNKRNSCASPTSSRSSLTTPLAVEGMESLCVNYSQANNLNPEPQVQKAYKIVRGLANGAALTRPPEKKIGHNVNYVPVELRIHNEKISDINRIPWSHAEEQDKRRIVRIERRQIGHIVEATFSVVGSAQENPVPREAPQGVDVVEVSCLKYQTSFSDNDKVMYCVTSVEILRIIEVLIGSTSLDQNNRRKEKGRIRSNLLPFWSGKSLPSKKVALSQDLRDPRVKFAYRIMSYNIRKPRWFDKNVRILSWNRISDALQRALQCYYAEVPEDSFLHTNM